MWRRILLSVAILALVTASCADDDRIDVPFTLEVSPEFVQGVIPGAVTGVLVTVTDSEPTADPVTITVTAEGATVTVEPSEIVAGEVAEVMLVADAATTERPIEIVVVGRRGALESTVTRSTIVMDWGDDRGPEAHAIFETFLEWLEENRPELGITAGTAFTGSMVAPGLLVVSHYLFLSDEWEIGLSWHVMIPPDDWAEIYLRPRHAPTPTLAFRLMSRSETATTGQVDMREVTVPVEVVR